MNWLTALEPAIVAVVQLVVVTAALYVARLARRRAAVLQVLLDALLGDHPDVASRPSESSSNMLEPTAPSPGQPEWELFRKTPVSPGSDNDDYPVSTKE